MARRDKHTSAGGGTALEEAPRAGRSPGGEGSSQGSPAGRSATGTALAAGGPISPAGFGASPWEMMRRMSEDLTSLFDSFGIGTGATGARPRTPSAETGRSFATWAPRIELEQRPGALAVRADLPGMDVNDIDVTVDDGMLVISGERSEEHRKEDDSVVRTELVYGRFYRAIPLPQGADESGITAIVRNGTLEVVIPVSQRERGRKVEVQSGKGQGQGKEQSQASRS